jgi:hypothetical protein
MRIHKLALIAATAGLAASVPLGRPPAPAPAFHPSALLRDGGLTVRDLPASSVSWRGGPVVAATGESVKLFVSNAYTPDVNDVQPWADFVAGLIHGPELALLTAYIATPAEVETLCDGVNVLGCYGDDTLVAIGEPVDGVQPQEVVRHEYGHHVAANRLNPPWLAVDWGTKRWATQQSVCTRSNAGSAYPGDEGLKYTLNPGEAFAEAYRVLNDTRAGAALDWPLVDPSFLPDAVALQAVADDVSVPWAGPTASVVHGRFTPSGRRKPDGRPDVSSGHSLRRRPDRRSGHAGARPRIPFGGCDREADLPRLRRTDRAPPRHPPRPPRAVRAAHHAAVTAKPVP